MPRGNGTGPVGAGPMTGKGVGYCAGNHAPGWQTSGGGGMQRGLRRNGKPRGFFRNHAQHAVASADAMLLQEGIDALHAKLASLEQQLAGLGGQQED
ncbi:hypothetical protein PDESU_05401 [Pontiella desulfatans]|uniref:DUF5320 domain-containing protein n=1 Tax=Pontiella desulfatans TaxID=2750659 RepID=A0A6C2UA96_PONDE|nr:DUF5320 domain-containing protein [Pontiella desulfatans]VGO16809.1 hypothetical protein PDESU_05401 [Pontiella desulfatans]